MNYYVIISKSLQKNYFSISRFFLFGMLFAFIAFIKGQNQPNARGKPT